MTLALVLASSLQAASPAAPVPAVYFTAARASEAGDSDAAAAMLRAALKDSPSDLWLHSGYLLLVSRGSISDPDVEADYRAFQAAEPAAPLRQLLLGLA